MINSCGNCANYVWGDNKTPLPRECITCTTTHVPNGQHPTPSHWKAKPQTNADRIRATDELATMLHAVKMGYAPWCDYHCENEGDDGCDNCIKEWLKQPADGGYCAKGERKDK